MNNKTPQTYFMNTCPLLQFSDVGYLDLGEKEGVSVDFWSLETGVPVSHQQTFHWKKGKAMTPGEHLKKQKNKLKILAFSSTFDEEQFLKERGFLWKKFWKENSQWGVYGGGAGNIAKARDFVRQHYSTVDIKPAIEEIREAVARSEEETGRQFKQMLTGLYQQQMIYQNLENDEEEPLSHVKDLLNFIPINQQKGGGKNVPEPQRAPPKGVQSAGKHDGQAQIFKRQRNEAYLNISEGNTGKKKRICVGMKTNGITDQRITPRNVKTTQDKKMTAKTTKHTQSTPKPTPASKTKTIIKKK